MIFLAVILDIIFILFSLKYVWWYRTKDMKKTRIMMYHMISEQIPQQKKSGLRVSPSMFEKHLEYFSNNGWKFIKMSELDNFTEENKIVANEPSANFFLMNFDKAKINSNEAFEKLATKRLILRKMDQYKIPNSLRLTIGNEAANEHFIKSIREICK